MSSLATVAVNLQVAPLPLAHALVVPMASRLLLGANRCGIEPLGLKLAMQAVEVEDALVARRRANVKERADLEKTREAQQRKASVLLALQVFFCRRFCFMGACFCCSGVSAFYSVLALFAYSLAPFHVFPCRLFLTSRTLLSWVRRVIVIVNIHTRSWRRRSCFCSGRRSSVCSWQANPTMHKTFR